MNYQPIFDRLIAKEIEKPKETKSGISILEKNDENVKKAEVLSVGNGSYDDGIFVGMQVRVGENILYEEHCAVPFFINGEKFLLLKQTDVLAKEIK